MLWSENVIQHFYEPKSSTCKDVNKNLKEVYIFLIFIFRVQQNQNIVTCRHEFCPTTFGEISHCNTTCFPIFCRRTCHSTRIFSAKESSCPFFRHKIERNAQDRLLQQGMQIDQICNHGNVKSDMVHHENPNRRK